MSRTVAVYDYRDGDGTLVAQKLRKEPGPNGARKSFSWRRPLPPDLRAEANVAEDEAAWVWGLEDGLYAPHAGDPHDWRPLRDAADPRARTLPGAVVGLYRLPQLLAEPFEHPVAVVEGEKKANALYALGLCAVSPPNGARQWDQAWGAHFAGRKVLVIPDNNAAGLGLAAVAAGSLLLHGAAAVKVVVPGDRWPVGPDEDVLDWLARVPPRDQRRALRDLFAGFPAYAAAPPAVP